MNHRLHIRLEQLERATDRLLQAAEALGDKSHQPPAPGQWSAAQVVHHLLVSESGIGQYIDRKLQAADGLEAANFRTFVRSRLLRVLLRLPFLRFKAPEKVGALTTDTVPALPELRGQWLAVRRRLEQTLNEYPSKLLDRTIFRHPRSGMLTIYQTLDFMLDHVLHHQKQIERIRKSLKS